MNPAQQIAGAFAALETTTAALRSLDQAPKPPTRHQRSLARQAERLLNDAAYILRRLHSDLSRPPHWH